MKAVGWVSIAAVCSLTAAVIANKDELRTAGAVSADTAESVNVSLPCSLTLYPEEAAGETSEDRSPCTIKYGRGYLTAGSADATETNVIPDDSEVQQILDEQAALYWQNPGELVMADVNESVNVRAEADEESERVGKLYKDCGAYIIEYTDSWTKVQSGDVCGWVKNDYLLFGDDAKTLYDDVVTLRATVTGQTLRVRETPSVDAPCLGMVADGDVFEALYEEDGWVAIDFEGADGFISGEYVSTEYFIDYGETMAAIEAREKAEKEAAEKAAAKAAAAKAAAAAKEAGRHQQYGAYAAEAADVTLLGALIQCEAGNQSYEGQVAVGAVVMNRVRSAAYPSTIYGVIYASGQFTPAGSGKVDRTIAAGVKPQCLQAAQAALDGYSNVGSATHFRRSGNHDGIVIGAHVFW